MNGNAPHFVLFSEASRRRSDDQGQMGRGWRFTLQSAEGNHRFVAGDIEPGTHGERLELLAVVRGLEALDQPSRVTLVTRSRYVSRGLTSGLETWRESGWQWEHFGQLVPVKNRDLWQRVDQALKFHRVECHRWRFDGPHQHAGLHRWRSQGTGVLHPGVRKPLSGGFGGDCRRRLPRRPSRLSRGLAGAFELCYRYVMGCLGRVLPTRTAG